LPAPSVLLKARIDQLIVLDDLALGGATPLSWFPIQADPSKGGSSLNDWLHLPWGAPEVMVLPGYHTVAENPAKRTARGAPGSEMFFSVMGMLASGSRTILLSRWRTGGQTGFVQELPQGPASDAYQRAMLVVMNSTLDLNAEPRIKKGTGNDAPKAESPFFWAGYMLIDPGEFVERKPGEPDDDESPPGGKVAPKPGQKAKIGEKAKPGAGPPPKPGDEFLPEGGDAITPPGESPQPEPPPAGAKPLKGKTKGRKPS
jgi:hypothetical protein